MVLKKNKFLYSSFFVKKFINNFFKKGKKQCIERLFLRCLFILKFKLKKNPLYIYIYILLAVRPYLELRSLRLGSVVYKIPVPLCWNKQLKQAIKLFVYLIRNKRLNQSFLQNILSEFYLVLQKKSLLLKQNMQLYKVASSNRAFAHFRW